jgi:hypothetical protein
MKSYSVNKPFMKLIGILSPIFIPMQHLWMLADPPVLSNIEDLHALLKIRRLIVDAGSWTGKNLFAEDRTMSPPLLSLCL